MRSDVPTRDGAGRQRRLGAKEVDALSRSREPQGSAAGSLVEPSDRTLPLGSVTHCQLGGKANQFDMNSTARFQVDPRLASLLGQAYRSSEEALRELVDNAWDADADRVTVRLPGVLDASPIVVEDNGSGMTELELREEYLRIASGRRTRKGDRSTTKHRRIRGRKGIGKFAGLMAADEMKVETWVRGTMTTVVITKADLTAARDATADLEAVDLPVRTNSIDGESHGTRITLTSLNRKFHVPSAEKFRSLLVAEYGREDGFDIVVNDARVAISDVPGKKFEQSFEVEDVGLVTVKFSVSEENKGVKGSGLAIRVGGKLIGRPTSLGLDQDDLLPPKLVRRVYGEVEADGLSDYVTADWGAIVENSSAFQTIMAKATTIVRDAIESTFKNEVSLARARWQLELNRRLAQLPENRRERANQLISKLLRRLYGEAHEKVETIVSVALEAFEHDDYWVVLKQIDDATTADVTRLAGVLGQLGLVDIAVVAAQVTNRLAFLDAFDGLIGNPETQENVVHRAIENNLWVLGPKYRLIASNKTLAKLLFDWLGREFAGERADKRPDLVLAALASDKVLLVEFKRPSHAITRDDENQAIKYRDDIQPYVPDRKIDLLLVGGRAPNYSSQYATPGLTVTTFTSIVAQARDELRWLFEQLAAE